MKTVLFPHSRDGLGGSVITGALLAKGLAETGEWKPIAIGNSAGPVVDYHRGLGIESVPLAESTGRNYTPNPNDGRLPRRVWKRFFLTRSAQEFLKQNKADVIHVNDESSALAWMLAARRHGIPVVWHVHQQRPQKSIDWLLRRLAAHIVFVADNNRVRFAGDIPANTTIHNGVDLEVYSPGELSRTGRMTVGFVSNLVDRKRPDWVVRAVAQLARDGIDVQVRLVGADFSTSGAAATRLAALAETEHLGDRYSYMGPRSDVPDVLRDIDVLALPSEKDKEAFPRIIVEAMACGVPVVATRVAGIPEAVIDGETGNLVDPESFEEFVDALRRVVTDNELRSQMSKESVEVAAARFSLQSNVDDVESIYNSLLNASAPGS